MLTASNARVWQPGSSGGSLIHDDSLSLFQKVLLSTDGTVTDLIAIYAKQAIRVRKVAQEITRHSNFPVLGLQDETLLLRRKVILSGAEKNYLFAESYFVFERFPEEVRRDLLETDQPIGLLWKEARMETYRELLDRRLETDAEVASCFELPPEAEILSRTYVIFYQRRPLGVITEKFPRQYFVD